MTSSKINVEALAKESDLYDLLGITSAPNDDFSKVDIGDIRRAYRKTALVYHPDKNPSKDAADKFHLLSVALEVLGDNQLRYIYDSLRQAQNAKKRKLQQLDATKRKMQMDLEDREAKARQNGTSSGSPFATRESTATKKPKSNNWSSSSVSQAVLDDLRNQADRLKQAKRQERQGRANEAQVTKPQPQPTDEAEPTKSQFSEKDRTVKVRWLRRRRKYPKEGDVDEETNLRKWMSQFGEIENVVVIPSSSTKKKYVSGLVVFSKPSNAFDAVSAGLPEKDEENQDFAIKDIKWAYGPPVVAQSPPNISGDKQDYEQATLMRLRQRQQERQQLEKEILQKEQQQEQVE